MKTLLIMVLFIVLNFENNMCIATGSVQAEYNSVKFIQLSMMQALTDINYIIGVNQVTSQIKQLQDQTPIKILAQEGYQTTKLVNVRYVLDFEVINKDKVKISYQVLMKVNPLNGKVVIDSFKQKQSTTTVQQPITSSTINTTNNTTKPTSTTPVPQTQLIKKSNYNNIGVDTINKGDLYLLIFLDNANKTIQKALQQIGVKSTKNDILYIGRLDGSDLIYYWVQVRILVDNLQKVLRVRGSQHKVTYEMKMIELVEDKSIVLGGNTSTNGSYNTNTNTSANTNNTTTNNNTTISSNSNSNNVSDSNPSSNNTASSNQSSQATVQIKDNKETLTVNSSTNINTSTTSSPTNTTPSTNTTSTQSSPPPQPYNSPIYQQLNQTLIIKSSGFEQLQSKLFTKDQPLILLTQKFLTSRPNKSTIKTYKAFVKNYALKAQYKMFFIDQVIDAPNIVVYQGFATYDFLKKRVYVISFGQILN